MYVYLGKSMSQMQNVKALAQKVEEFLKQPLTCPIAEMCFKENSESKEECVCPCVLRRKQQDMLVSS